jgi:integrase
VHASYWSYRQNPLTLKFDGEAPLGSRVPLVRTSCDTPASRLLAKTGNLRLVQQALGHRSIASTIRYTRVPTAALKAALEAV